MLGTSPTFFYQKVVVLIRTDRFSNENAKSVGDKRRRMKSCFGGDKHPVALAMSVLVETNTNSSKKGQIGEKF